ncbi:STAS domain-containing protein [Paractinoplanes brasiliensis]|uniref:Anti-sigma factor antagonist n=1 Tax=Paractinoplanes brasiliensis TaxID=52695 RepID=A0A4V3C607_9ACTN|nr:STAS domain-containing protein [Actinoplanes brasiliensis]TDO31858.1 SpoIIAA-like anti-anti-sigma regulatory factor [Actinoplanes brasiliensis]GID27902.1 anti-sigma factor antagonist [Actinoplanes brasiliensis]
MSLEYRLERHGGRITVAPEGDISLETVDVLREVLRSIVDSGEAEHIDVDMRSVTFLDSSGIGVLVAARKAAAARGATFTLREPTAMVLMVLQVAHLDGVLLEDTPAS